MTMAIRQAVQALVALGPLPNESTKEEVLAESQEQFAANTARVQSYQDAIEAVEQSADPLTQEEARALLPIMGREGDPDDTYYGLRYALIHVLERTTGGVPLPEQRPSNVYIAHLWDRRERGRKMRKAG
jgi:hypothetical protein